MNVGSVLSKERLNSRGKTKRSIRFCVRPGFIGAEADKIGKFAALCQDSASLADCIGLDCIEAAGHRSRQRAKDIDGRIPPRLRNPAIKHGMTVQDSPDGVCNRLVVIISLDEYGEKPGDAACANAGACTFEQAWKFGKHAWGIASRCRRLAGGKTDFTQSEAKPGHAVDEQQNRTALIPEILGDCHGSIRGFTPDQRRLVRCGDNDDRTGQGRTKIILDEFPYLAPAFPNQSEHDDIALRLLGKHRQQCRFSNA